MFYELTSRCTHRKKTIHLKYFLSVNRHNWVDKSWRKRLSGVTDTSGNYELTHAPYILLLQREEKIRSGAVHRLHITGSDVEQLIWVRENWTHSAPFPTWAHAIHNKCEKYPKSFLVFLNKLTVAFPLSSGPERDLHPTH